MSIVYCNFDAYAYVSLNFTWMQPIQHNVEACYKFDLLWAYDN